MNDLDYSDFEPAGKDLAGSMADGGGVSVKDAVLPKIHRNDRAGSRGYPLLVPLKVDGRWLRRLTLRHPTQGDIDDLGNGVLESRRDLLCRLIGQPNEVVRALSWVDSEAIQQMFSDILPSFMKD